MTAQEIAKFYANNPNDVFNAMIDALVACGPELIPLAQALENAGLDILEEYGKLNQWID